MFFGTDFPMKYELMAESDTDYYFQFLGWGFHFIKDPTGKATALQIDSPRPVLAQRIEP